MNTSNRSTVEIFKDWAKYTYQDMSDDILENAFASGKLLESLDFEITQYSPDKLEVTFTYLLYGAFQDMGVSRGGYTFKPHKWYARNISYSVNKLGEMMLKRYGSLGMARLRETLPDKINLG